MTETGMTEALLSNVLKNKTEKEAEKKKRKKGTGCGARLWEWLVIGENGITKL